MGIFENRNTVGYDCSYEITELDFYPPQDDRCYVSGVEDVDGGDSFADYSEWFWGVYGSEIYDDCWF